MKMRTFIVATCAVVAFSMAGPSPQRPKAALPEGFAIENTEGFIT
ncbi:MAG TPA: hypothetical protein VGM26_02510 [Rhizomicrobium sp.]